MESIRPRSGLGRMMSLWVALPILATGCSQAFSGSEPDTDAGLDGSPGPALDASTDASFDGGPDAGRDADLDGSTVCPPVACNLACLGGFLKNDAGCDICDCAPPTVDAASSSCTTDRDCEPDAICGFEIADKCTAKGACFVTELVTCNSLSPGCACDGTSVNLVCNGLPTGYARAPVSHAGACTDAGSTGKTGDASAI
jgi:hypothetical protein